MENQIIYNDRVVNLAIGNGESNDSTDISLPDGECIGIAVKMAGTKPGVIVNLSIYDGGTPIVHPQDWQFFEKSDGGRWIDSVRNFNFRCNRNFKIHLEADQALGADFKLQVLFIIQNAIKY